MPFTVFYPARMRTVRIGERQCGRRRDCRRRGIQGWGQWQRDHWR